MANSQILRVLAPWMDPNQGWDIRCQLLVQPALSVAWAWQWNLQDILPILYSDLSLNFDINSGQHSIYVSAVSIHTPLFPLVHTSLFLVQRHGLVMLTLQSSAAYFPALRIWGGMVFQYSFTNRRECITPEFQILQLTTDQATYWLHLSFIQKRAIQLVQPSTWSQLSINLSYPPKSAALSFSSNTLSLHST